MTNLNPDICRRIRDARREAKISQSELAQEVGCKQSALSMFEQGQTTKINDEVVVKLAKKFSIDLEEKPGKREEAPSPASFSLSAFTGPSKGFCPNPSCPSNKGYDVDGRRLYMPDRDKADPVGGRFCAICGEVLERKCPNCGAPVHAGSVCSLCGEPYIAAS
ncbi:MAG: helix-turn-helix domain-containing protein [Kiritimatiellae bacterium]|nr:helix-turn-helix domain-containing protein [Kiritimatiellia bacterium]